MNYKQIIIDYITQNKDILKEKIEPYIETRDRVLQTEAAIFHSEIQTQCKDIAKWIISKEISQNGIVTIEQSMVELSDMGIENIYPEFFK